MSNEIPEKNPSFLKTDIGNIAYEYVKGDDAYPTIVFLHGLHSDMYGTKIVEMIPHLKAKNISYLRLEYFGHGDSEGDFEFFTISKAVHSAKEVIKHLGLKRILCSGASTGGWVTLLLAKDLPEVKGMVTVAAAPDFTEDLYWAPLPESEKQDWQEKGVRIEPGFEEGQTFRIGFDFVKDGRENFLIRNDEIENIYTPARILHGMSDDVVPFETSQAIAERIGSADCELHLVKEAYHRFSDERALEILSFHLLKMAEQLKD